MKFLEHSYLILFESFLLIKKNNGIFETSTLSMWNKCHVTLVLEIDSCTVAFIFLLNGTCRVPALCPGPMLSVAL